jgi:hypothetical protein
MDATSREIAIKNLGPIDELRIRLPGPGVTTVSAPNGSGKSIAMAAMQGLAAGRGKLPLRDGQDRGSVDLFGLHATINPKQTRVAGEFALNNLEGKLDIGVFVKPGVQDPVAADKRRIKALVSLLGIEADAKLFSANEAFDADEFALVVQQDAYSCTDLVDMANRIARDYHAEARQWERSAHDDEAKAKSIEQQISEIDMEAESDPDVLQEQFLKAQQAYSQAGQKRKLRADKQQAAEVARAELMRWDAMEVSTAEEAQQQLDDEKAELQIEEDHVQELHAQIVRLTEELEQAERNCELIAARVKTCRAKVELAEAHARSRGTCLQVIADAENFQAPDEAEMATIKENFAAAQAAMERGVRVRDARSLASQVENYRGSAEARTARAEHHRACAAATDAVLCTLIATDAFRVVTVGQNKRLQTFHEGRQAWVNYHELSEAEKWTRAIDVGVARVGDGGLLFICQEAWEGIDVWNRQTVHDHAVARNVYILTIEATRHAEDGRDFVVKPFQA